LRRRQTLAFGLNDSPVGDLVDEYFLWLSPILFGNGKRLFRESDRARKLSLVDRKPTTTGGLPLTFRPS
jgi:dihydrofolate reductase